MHQLETTLFKRNSRKKTSSNWMILSQPMQQVLELMGKSFTYLHFLNVRKLLKLVYSLIKIKDVTTVVF